jgi:hypothetical protein
MTRVRSASRLTRRTPDDTALNTINNTIIPVIAMTSHPYGKSSNSRNVSKKSILRMYNDDDPWYRPYYVSIHTPCIEGTFIACSLLAETTPLCYMPLFFNYLIICTRARIGVLFGVFVCVAIGYLIPLPTVKSNPFADHIESHIRTLLSQIMELQSQLPLPSPIAGGST